MSEPSAAVLRFERKVAALRPDIQLAWLRGWKRLQAELTPRAIERLLESGGLDRLLAEALTPEQVNAAFTDFRRHIRAGSESAVTYFVKDLPKAAQVRFDYLSPLVTRALERLDTAQMRGLTQELRDTVTQVVLRGLEQGWGPRQTARYLHTVLPLGPSQERAIWNFRAMLESDDPDALWTALQRKLRDKRYDKMVERAMQGERLSSAQIDRMVTRYRRNMEAFNAETHARTATIQSMKQGQQQVWQQAIDRGTVNAANLWKRWKTVGDDRVRPLHRQMNGTTVLATEPYRVPGVGEEMVPGELEYNCRCVSLFFMSTEDQHTSVA